MDAPIYPPATTYEQPVAVPYRMTTANSSIAAVTARAEVAALAKKTVPALGMISAVPQLSPYVGLLSLRDLAMFGMVKAQSLDALDAQLAELPPYTEF